MDGWMVGCHKTYFFSTTFGLFFSLSTPSVTVLCHSVVTSVESNSKHCLNQTLASVISRRIAVCSCVRHTTGSSRVFGCVSALRYEQVTLSCSLTFDLLTVHTKALQEQHDERHVAKGREVT